MEKKQQSGMDAELNDLLSLAGDKEARNRAPVAAEEDDSMDALLQLSSNKLGDKNKYQKDIALARSLCIRKRFDEAKAKYEQLIEDDPYNLCAFIGLVRVESVNFTKYDGENIEDAICIVQQIAGDKDARKEDADYDAYLTRRKNYFADLREKMRKAELAEKARQEAERQAKIKAEQEAKARQEAERQAKIKAEQEAKARQEAERQAKIKAEQEAKARQEAARQAELAKKEAERQAKIRAEQEAARKARQLQEDIDRWYLSGKKGDADSQFRVGECFFNGNGVTKSYKEAASWFKMAAEQGHKGAMEYLGDCYLNGLGVEKSAKMALYWYGKAK